MKTTRILAVVAGLTALTLACVAQEEEDEGPLAFTYASYFYCDNGPVKRADELVAEDAERMDGLVEAGTISGWGWLAHHTGGQWDRIFYFQADTVDALLDGLEATADSGDEEEDDAEDEGPGFGEICPRHDDYIWSVENGSEGDNRGEVGFSVYHVCDINREERADEIVDEHIAPILNQFVEDGKLTSWGWSSHVVGGRFRRLQTMTGPDVKSLLKARGEAIDAIYEEDSEAGTEFSEICGPHVDYVWDIVHET